MQVAQSSRLAAARPPRTNTAERGRPQKVGAGAQACENQSPIWPSPMTRAAWLGLALALCGSGLGDGQGSTGTGLLGGTMPSTKAIVQTTFCRAYGCLYAGSAQVGGLERGVPDTDERFSFKVQVPGQPKAAQGVLGLTHDARKQVTSVYVRLRPVPLTAAPLLPLGQRFAGLALGTAGKLSTEAVQSCLKALTAEVGKQPTGGLADLGQGKQAEVLSCSYLPIKAQPRLFDVSFAADTP